jgi:CcmD family protein
MSTEGKYVAAAYLVVFVALLGYVLIIALKLQRLSQEVAELVELAQKRREAAQRPVRAERGPVEGTAVRRG